MEDYSWIHDDITWCGNECSNTKCDRNLANRLTKGGYYSAAMFKNTPMCPLYKEEVRVSEKYMLSPEEASVYFHIGENKLRQMINDNPDADWHLKNGSRMFIKRKKMEEFLDKLDSI